HGGRGCAPGWGGVPGLECVSGLSATAYAVRLGHAGDYPAAYADSRLFWNGFSRGETPTGVRGITPAQAGARMGTWPRAISWLEDLDLHRRAIARVPVRQPIPRAVRDADEHVHLGAALNVIARLRDRFLDVPAAVLAAVLVVHEEVHRVRYVFRQQAIRGERRADDLVAAILHLDAVRLVEEAVTHAVVDVVDPLRLRRLFHNRRHRPAERGHQRVAFHQLVPRNVGRSGLRPVAGA